MKVFISSVIHGYEEYREAAAEGVEVLGYEVSRSEDFSARPDTPQQACLSEVRASDVVILLLGERYGTKQKSGLSATQEEYNEAKRSNKPVLVFIESNIKTEFDQAEFIKKVDSWTSGHLVKKFSDSEQLKIQITTSLHQLTLQQTKLILEDDANERAKNLLSVYNINYQPRLLFGLVVSPQKQIFRPSDLDGPSFRNKIHSCGENGDFPILNREQISVEYRNKALVIRQSFGLLSINQQGDIYIAQDLSKNNLSHINGLPVIIEEQVKSRLYSCLQFCRCILQTVDAIRDLPRFVVAVCIKDNQFTPWRTLKKHRESPNRMYLADNYQEMMPEALGPFAYYHLENGLNKICDDLVSIIKSEVHQG